MNDYRLESPPILRDFLSYHETIKAHSQKTVDEYFLDLRNFFRYLKQSRDPSLRDLPLSEISIMDVDLDFVKKVTLTDIYAYMTYLSRDRVLHQNSDVSDYGLNAASRARKIATIRSFYNYLVNKAHLLDTNPCKDLDSPKIKKSLPKYLTLDESVQLLQSVDGQNRERDYCILTIFLNCGLRISELCGLDLQDIQDDALRVLGKGNKVRIVYLNDACKDALRASHRRCVGLEAVAETAAPEAPDSTVLDAVMALPKKYREAVYLYYYEGYSVREIASMLGQSEAAVSAHLSRGRKSLRGTLGGEFYEQRV
ncbi:recombinase XerC [bacterium]|nr:recombinase XerC [bacterium]